MTRFTIDFTRPFGEIVDELSKLKNQPVEGPEISPTYSMTPPSCRRNGSTAPLAHYDFAQQCIGSTNLHGVHLSTHLRDGTIVNQFFEIDEAVRIYLGFQDGFNSLINNSETPDEVKRQISHFSRNSIHGYHPILIQHPGMKRPCEKCGNPTYIEVHQETGWMRWCGC